MRTAELGAPAEQPQPKDFGVERHDKGVNVTNTEQRIEAEPSLFDILHDDERG